MQTRTLPIHALVALTATLALAGCRRAAAPAKAPAAKTPAAGAPAAGAPAAAPAPRPERTVFTDSLLHAENCAPLEPGQDWRKVCTPIDQRNRRVRVEPPAGPPSSE